MISETRPLFEITQEAIQLLYRELGVVNTVRFLNQFTTGFGDYTQDRNVENEGRTLGEILDELHQYQAQRTPTDRDT